MRLEGVSFAIGLEGVYFTVWLEGVTNIPVAWSLEGVVCNI